MAYLWVKIRTSSPEDLLARLKGLSPQTHYYFPGERLLLLVYPFQDPDSLLRALQERMPEAAFEETELRDQTTLKPTRFRIGPWVFYLSLGSESPSGEIYLRSNLAFGSGRHPTTRLCLKLLAELWSPSLKKVLDLGCGSGILALAAATLGARVLALDIDPRASLEARHNVEKNGLLKDVLVVNGSLSALRPGSFDLVLANLTIGTLLTLGPEIYRMVRPGGWAILSGFSKAQKASLLQAFSKGRLEEERAEEGWLALALRF